MGKLPEHVPFFTHSPPHFLHFPFFLAHFLFVTIPHFLPFSPIPPFFHGPPETGRPPETETSKAGVTPIGWDAPEDSKRKASTAGESPHGESKDSEGRGAPLIMGAGTHTCRKKGRLSPVTL